MRQHQPQRLEIQLIIAFSLCMLLLTVGSALGTAWWVNQVETKLFIDDSQHTVSNFAENSRLALLFDSQELADEVLTTLSQNPNVDRAWIINSEDHLLSKIDSLNASKQRPIQNPTQSPSQALGNPNDSLSDYQDESDLLEEGPAELTDTDTSEPLHTDSELLSVDKTDNVNSTERLNNTIRINKQVYESDNETGQPIGSVHVIFNTQKLQLVQQNIILGVTIISTIIACVLMGMVFILSKRISQPLVKFIKSIENYEDHKHINILDFQSTRELQQVAIAFEALMTRIDKNAEELQSFYERLLEETRFKEEAKKERNELHKRLVQSQKMESIGQLTSGIAHDFNNILGSILGFSQLASEMLEDEEELEDVFDYVEEVRAAGNRAKQIVSQLLAFSRVSQHDPKPLQISAEIKSVMDLLRPMLPTSIEIINNIDSEDLSQVTFDPTEFSQTIMNLCINARDAIGLSGSITLSLHHEYFTESKAGAHTHCTSCSEVIAGDFLVLTVEDNGSGISKEQINAIFEPFFTTKDVNKGTGLGLSMVHGVVHQNHGHILVESEINQYTRFKLILKACHKRLEAEPEAAPREAPEAFIENTNLVLIDDDTQFLRFMQTALEENGCTVFSCSDAEVALNYLSKHHSIIDLVITDEIMPKMTGIEFIRAMTEAELTTPVIVCSGYTKYNASDYMEYEHVKGFLKKPVGIEELLNSVIDITSPSHAKGGER